MHNKDIVSPPIKGKLNPTASQPVAEFASLDLTKNLTPAEKEEDKQQEESNVEAPIKETTLPGSIHDETESNNPDYL